MAKSTNPDIQLLAALADPTRMEILRELSGAPEVCACDFTSCCDVSQPTVSHHLKVLRDAGAVISERRNEVNMLYWRRNGRAFALVGQADKGWRWGLANDIGWQLNAI